MDSVTHRCILVFFGVSQTIQLLNKIINMLIPAFSNKITNVTWKMRPGMLFVFNGPWVPSGGTYGGWGYTWEAWLTSRLSCLQILRQPLTFPSSDFNTEEMELMIVLTSWFGVVRGGARLNWIRPAKCSAWHVSSQ